MKSLTYKIESNSNNLKVEKIQSINFNVKVNRSKSFYCLYKFLQIIVGSLFKILYRVKIYNTDKIPLDKKLILCSNHISYADPVFIDAFFPRLVFFMAKIEIFQNFIFKSFLKFFNAFPVNRERFDRQAIRNSLEVLKNNQVLGIFPEGTRSPSGVIKEGQRGVGLIAVMSNCDILPMAISGTNKIIQKPKKRLFFPKVKIIYGSLINTSEIINKYGQKEAVDVIVLKTMEEIKKLYKQIE